jgi:SAM-dependent methyltransferase
MFSAVEWQQRFLQQARWTAELRGSLARQLGFAHARRILEVGCGAGAITSSLPHSRFVAGLDIRLDFLRLAHAADGRISYTCGDGLALPYAPATFDLTLCHFFLLWLSRPLNGLREMARVTHPGGSVLALAEPDYGGRIDHPAALARLGQMQGEALRRQGANPNLGRELAALFREAGLMNVSAGLLSGHWASLPSEDAWESEWSVLRADLAGMIPSAELDALRLLDAEAWTKGERILFVPTFYAWGTVP